MTPGREVEKSGEMPLPPSPPGQVMVSGQIQNGAREILEIVSTLKDVENGVLRILCREARGLIGIANGKKITGAEVTGKSQFGPAALLNLLSVEQGMFAFLSMDNEQTDLNQSMDIDISQLLDWRPIGNSTQEPSINAALKHFLGVDNDDDPEFKSYMAWGQGNPPPEEALPNLTELTSTFVNTSELSTIQPERIVNDLLLDSPLDDPRQPGSPRGTEAVAGTELPPPPAPARLREPEASKFAKPAVTAQRKSIQFLNPTPSPESVKQSSQPNLLEERCSETQDTTALESEEAQLEKRLSTTQEQQALRQISANTKAQAPKLNPIVLPAAFTKFFTAQKKKLILAAAATSAVLLFVLGIQLLYGYHYQQGLTAYNAGNDRLAKDQFTACIGINANAAQALYHRAMAESHLGDQDSALKDFDSAIAKDPKNTIYFAGRAQSKLQNKDYEGAMVDCDTVLAFSPNMAEAYRLRAMSQRYNRHFKSAIDECTLYINKGIGQTPAGKSEVMSNRAYCHMKLGQFPQAITDYTAALAYAPTNTALLAARAACYGELHQYAKALADYRKASQSSPDDKTLIHQIKSYTALINKINNPAPATATVTTKH